jgi:hypothetical protein
MYALLEVLMYMTSTRVPDARYHKLAYRQLTTLVSITSLVSTPTVTQGWLFSVPATSTPQVTLSSLSNRAYHVQHCECVFEFDVSPCVFSESLSSYLRV